MIHNRKDDRGVSEAIGFIIMFTIVLTGIAMVSLIGYPMLLETQITSDERNMEQAMIAIQNDVKILTFSNVPYRDTTVRISGGSLSTTDYDPSGNMFTIDYSNEDGSSASKSFSPGEIKYESSEGTAVLALMNGGVFRRDKLQEGSVMVAEPRWFYDEDEDTLVLYLIYFDTDRDYHETGIRDIQLSMKTQPVTTDIDYSGASNKVSVTYTSDPNDDYSVAWRNYLTGNAIVSNGFYNPPNSNTYTLEEVKRLIIKEYTVKIESL